MAKYNQINWNPRIIIITAFSDKENQNIALEEGADAFLEKPINW